MPPEDRGEDKSGEEGGPGPPWIVIFLGLFLLAVHVEATSSSLCLSLLLVVWEAHNDRLGWSGRKGLWYIETATAVALGNGGAAAMALQAAWSAIEIQDHTHRSVPVSNSVLAKRNYLLWTLKSAPVFCQKR